MSNVAKNAYCPKPFAEVIEGFSKYWENEPKGDMGKPVAVFTKAAAEHFLKQAPALLNVKITEKGKNDTPGVTVGTFIRLAAERSEKQGYLSLSDLQELANISAQVSPKLKSTHRAFRNVCGRLVALGTVANAKGNKEKNEVDDTGIDFSMLSLDLPAQEVAETTETKKTKK